MQEPIQDIKGCTVGVIQTSNGMLFFKNRDLPGQYVRNRITVFRSTPETHTLQGVNLKTGALEGVSIGVNRHKICVANTHIVSTGDITYDVLCERLIDETRDKQDVPRNVADFMRQHSVQGGRILVSAPEWSYLVEVLEDRFELMEIDTHFVMTNHFSLIPYQAERSDIREKGSSHRLEVASRMIKDVSNAGALKSMLRSHVPDKGELSICNHRQDGGGTESSHIIQVQGDYVGWSSLVGYPCENDYHTIQVFQ